jgi:hypothetical protein
MKPTGAQLTLLGHLIDEALNEQAAVERRWGSPKIGPFARARAEAGQLLLLRDWTEDAVLSRNGDVIMIETEDGDGRPPRLATDRERRISLFRAMEKYPELLSFLPQRPPEAIECPSCEGTGVHLARFTNPQLRHILCRCGGAGWILPEERPHEA